MTKKEVVIVDVIMPNLAQLRRGHLDLADCERLAELDVPEGVVSTETAHDPAKDLQSVIRTFLNHGQTQPDPFDAGVCLPDSGADKLLRVIRNNYTDGDSFGSENSLLERLVTEASRSGNFQFCSYVVIEPRNSGPESLVNASVTAAGLG